MRVFFTRVQIRILVIKERISIFANTLHYPCMANCPETNEVACLISSSYVYKFISDVFHSIIYSLNVLKSRENQEKQHCVLDSHRNITYGDSILSGNKHDMK